MTKQAHSIGSGACCGLQPPAVDALPVPRLDPAEQWVALVPTAAGMAQSLAQPWQRLQPFLPDVSAPTSSSLSWQVCFASLGGASREEDPNKELY